MSLVFGFFFFNPEVGVDALVVWVVGFYLGFIGVEVNVWHESCCGFAFICSDFIEACSAAQNRLRFVELAVSNCVLLKGLIAVYGVEDLIGILFDEGLLMVKVCGTVYIFRSDHGSGEKCDVGFVGEIQWNEKCQ